MNDGPGFLVNRLLLPYMNEAALLLCEGAAIAEIERAAKDFGMPMGPITLYDVVGLDVAVHAGRTMLEAFPDRVVPATILPQLFDRGRLGQKVGRGFFDYGPRKGANRRAAPTATRSPTSSTNAAPATSGSSSPRRSPIGCSCRCCSKLPAFSKTASCADARDVDLGADLRHRVSTVQRRPVLLGRPGGTAKNPRQTQALRRRSANASNPTKLLTKVAKSGRSLLRLTHENRRCYRLLSHADWPVACREGRLSRRPLRRPGRGGGPRARRADGHRSRP